MTIPSRVKYAALMILSPKLAEYLETSELPTCSAVWTCQATVLEQWQCEYVTSAAVNRRTNVYDIAWMSNLDRLQCGEFHICQCENASYWQTEYHIISYHIIKLAASPYSSQSSYNLFMITYLTYLPYSPPLPTCWWTCR